jgi:tetratricopeptide (TPR) repeat protein
MPSPSPEPQIDRLLSRIDAGEKSARRRAMVYTFVPILVTGALVAYTSHRIVEGQATIRRLDSEAAAAREAGETYRRELEEYRRRLAQTREALKSAREGINAFHQGQYDQAAEQYEQALAADPENPYVLNLKGYALFKARRLTEAAAALERSVAVDPGYGYGYFDLARVYCALGRFEDATRVARRAGELRPDLKTVMRQGDGEFKRLCQPVLHTLD